MNNFLHCYLVISHSISILHLPPPPPPPVPFFLVWSVLNSVAWAYHSTQALPFTTILLLMIVWALGEWVWPCRAVTYASLKACHPFCVVGFPLTVLGGIFGKNVAKQFDAPCRTKNIAREIPSVPWYRSLLVHMAIGGFLPFRYCSLSNLSLTQSVPSCLSLLHCSCLSLVPCPFFLPSSPFLPASSPLLTALSPSFLPVLPSCPSFLPPPHSFLPPPQSFLPPPHSFLPPPQCHFRGAVLYICHAMGQGGLYSLWHTSGGHVDCGQRHCLHLCGPHLLPAVL